MKRLRTPILAGCLLALAACGSPAATGDAGLPDAAADAFLPDPGTDEGDAWRPADVPPADPDPGDAQGDPDPGPRDDAPGADAPDPAPADPGPDAGDTPDDASPPPACLQDPALCDDGDDCTRDGCDPVRGCLHEPLDGTACDDGSACTRGDRCQSGSCVPGEALSCDDGDPCTDDPCDPERGCLHPFNNAPCSDGNPCTAPDLCDGDGACRGEPVTGLCSCLATPDCKVFEDGNPCHGSLVCADGRCVVDPGTVPSCDTSQDPPCRRTACDPATGFCTPSPLPDRTACEDGSACTLDDRCLSGQCAGGAPPGCDDGNPCTTDGCDPASGCRAVPNRDLCAGARCQDGMLLPASFCADGACPAQVPRSCDDLNACTVGDRCEAGACLPGATPLPCDDGNPCTDDGCAPATGCFHRANQAPCAAGECLGLVHLSGATCSEGACPQRVATDCDTGLPCLDDACIPALGCFSTPREGTCRIDGACRGAGERDPGDPCRACDPWRDPDGWSPLPDATPCGIGRACLEGACRGPMITEILALNRDSARDEDGDTSDWIEIYNPTGLPVSLEGWRLTDDPAKPSKWTFPAVTLAPNAYRVVWASEKNRRLPEAPLHTNFKLSGDGEHLSLRDPEGVVVQAFDPFPRQVEDASWGPAVQVTRTRLLSAGAGASWWIPRDGPPPADWASTAFDDAAAGWRPGLTGIGFDLTVPTAPASDESLGPPLADSAADWSAAGIQGQAGWWNGYWDRTADPDGTYQAGDFTPFPRGDGPLGPGNAWDGTAWDWPGGDPPFTFLGQVEARPSGPGTGPEHRVIRRWVADTRGPLVVEWLLAKALAGGNGVTGAVLLRGEPVDEATIDGADTVGVVRMAVLPDVQPGDPVDFVLGPEGPDGLPDDADDLSLLSGVAWRLPAVRDRLGTSVGNDPADVPPGLFVRVPFHVPDPRAVNRLTLHMHHDDGFAAWLNGRPAASANAPADPAWDSLATEGRSLQAALEPADFEIPDPAGRLLAGGNVLALQGLNVAADDPTLLLLPEIDGRKVWYLQDRTRYYGVTTPGADNDDGASGVGPIVQHLTASGAALPGQDVAVWALAMPTDALVTQVTLFYRVMFGPEVAVPMLPQGQDTWSAAIPASALAPGQMVRWRIEAADAAGLRNVLPPFVEPLDSEQYFGTVVEDPSVSTNLPLFHWFVEDFAAANTRTGTRCGLFYGGEFYDNVQFDLHGQSTSGGAFPKKSYNVDFNADHRFRLSADLRRMKDINLLTNYADKSKVRNTLAYEAFRDAGAGHHLAFPVRVQRNGAFFSVADFVEDPDDRWLERLGLDPEAPLYKMYDGLYNPAMGEKKNRKDQDNSDLAAFIAGLDATGDALRAFVYDHVNLPAMANFYAGLTLTADMDCCHKNFYAYRDAGGSGEWWYLPWDVDLTFGRNWIRSLTYFDDTMHPENPFFTGGGNKLTAILWAMPEFREMYQRRLRSLVDALQQPPDTPAAQLRFERRIDELLAAIGADGTLDFDAWPKWGEVQTMAQAAQILKEQYLAPRRTFLYETQVQAGLLPGPQGTPAVRITGGDPSPPNPAEAWVSLENPNDFAVDLTGWRLQGDVAYTFPAGAVLPAGGTVHLSPDKPAFRARALPPTGGLGLYVLGPWQGVLAAVGSLSLLDAAGNPVPSVP